MVRPFTLDITRHARQRFLERAGDQVFDPRVRSVRYKHELTERDVCGIMLEEHRRGHELIGPERMYVAPFATNMFGTFLDQQVFVFDEHVYVQKDISIVTFLVASNELLNAIRHVPVSMRLVVHDGALQPILRERRFGAKVLLEEHAEDTLREAIRRGVQLPTSNKLLRRFIGPITIEGASPNPVGATVECDIYPSVDRNIVREVRLSYQPFDPERYGEPKLISPPLSAPPSVPPESPSAPETISVPFRGATFFLSLHNLLASLGKHLPAFNRNQWLTWTSEHAGEAYSLTNEGVARFFPSMRRQSVETIMGFAFDLAGTPSYGADCRTLILFARRGRNFRAESLNFTTTDLSLNVCRIQRYIEARAT